MKTYIYVAFISYADEDNNEVTVYMGTRALSTGAGFTPSPNAFIDDRLKDPGLVERHMFSPRTTRGKRLIQHSEVRIANDDGLLDSWKDMAFDGRVFKLYRVLAEDMGDFSEYELVFAGYAEQPHVDTDIITLLIRDPSHRLNRPVLTERYTGQNALPAGLEGTSNDLRGRIKPFPIGYIHHATLPNVNTSRYVYQISVYQLVGNWGWNLYDKGVSLLQGIERALADIDAGYTAIPFTVTVGTSTASTGATNHNITNGDPITLMSDGTLPTTTPQVDETQTYYGRALSATTFSIHATANDAITNTSPRVFTSAGSGTHDMAKNRTAQGRWDYVNSASGFYARLGTKPEGTITCTGYYAPTGYNVSPQVLDPEPNTTSINPIAFASVIWKLRELAGDLPASGLHVDTTEVAGSDDYAYTGCGLWIDDDMTFLEAFDKLSSEGASVSWKFDSTLDSTMRFQHVKDPAGQTPVAVLEDRQIIRRGAKRAFERVISNDDDKGIPPRLVNVMYARSYTVQRSNELITSAIAQLTLAFMSQEWRSYALTNTDVLDRWPNAPEINIYSNAGQQGLSSTAFTEANRLLPLYDPGSALSPPAPGSIVRSFYEIEYPLEDVETLREGDYITVKVNRFDLNSGKNVLILGMKPSRDEEGNNTVILIVWG